MEVSWALIAVGVALLLFGAYASWTAGRLDRLHTRVDFVRAALEKELAQRSALALDLAKNRDLDAASSALLLDAAQRARAAGPLEEREQAESALTRAIHATGTEAELSLAMRRVQLARRFHNDIVVSARDLRHRRVVRWFRLAGHAPMPATIELEDGR